MRQMAVFGILRCHQPVYIQEFIDESKQSIVGER
jgi:hypothetical protein